MNITAGTLTTCPYCHHEMTPVMGLSRETYGERVPRCTACDSDLSHAPRPRPDGEKIWERHERYPFQAITATPVTAE